MSLAHCGQRLLGQARSTTATISSRAGRTPSQNSARAQASPCGLQKRLSERRVQSVSQSTRTEQRAAGEYRCDDKLFVYTAKTEKGCKRGWRPLCNKTGGANLEPVSSGGLPRSGLLSLKKRHVVEDSNGSFCELYSASVRNFPGAASGGFSSDFLIGIVDLGPRIRGSPDGRSSFVFCNCNSSSYLLT